MTKIKFQIKNKWTGRVLFEYESDTIKEAVVKAVDDCACLRGADLRGAYLLPIKNDLFIVLMHSIPEIPHLKKSLIEGKINGSTYDGECACLSGTAVNGAVKNNGPQQNKRISCIMSVRNSSRPIERFFLGIKSGTLQKIISPQNLSLNGSKILNFYYQQSHEPAILNS